MFTFHTVNSENWEEVLDIFWNYFMPWEPATRLAGCCTKKRLQDIQFGFYAQKHVKKENMLDGKKQQE